MYWTTRWRILWWWASVPLIKNDKDRKRQFPSPSTLCNLYLVMSNGRGSVSVVETLGVLNKSWFVAIKIGLSIKLKKEWSLLIKADSASWRRAAVSCAIMACSFISNCPSCTSRNIAIKPVWSSIISPRADTWCFWTERFWSQVKVAISLHGRWTSFNCYVEREGAYIGEDARLPPPVVWPVVLSPSPLCVDSSSPWVSLDTALQTPIVSF